MPPNWYERPIEEIAAFAVDRDLKKFVNSYRINRAVNNFMSYVWSQIPDDCVVEYRFTIGPQIGFDIGKAGVAEVKADLTLLSLPINTMTFEKRKGKYKETAVFFSHKFQSVNGVATSEEGGYVPVELTSKVGLQADAGTFSLGHSVGRKVLTDFHEGGTIDVTTFTETSSQEGRIGGKVIQEFRYGEKLPRKIENGWNFEIKTIIGIELKVIHERIEK